MAFCHTKANWMKANTLPESVRDAKNLTWIHISKAAPDMNLLATSSAFEHVNKHDSAPPPFLPPPPPYHNSNLLASYLFDGM